MNKEHPAPVHASRVFAIQYSFPYTTAVEEKHELWAEVQRERVSTQEPWRKELSDAMPVHPQNIVEVLQRLAEPSYREYGTASFIGDAMLSLGFRLDARSGQKPHETELVMAGKDSPKVYLRCDLDAISLGSGFYGHHCGHAVNMASMLTLARRLKENGIEDVGFIFQPAEEGPGNAHDGYVHPKGFGGGQYLRAKGIYHDAPAIVSCHIDTSLKDGEARISEGFGTAAAYRFTYKSEGVSAHAALPWQGKNPLNAELDFRNDLMLLKRMFAWLPDGSYGHVEASRVETSPCELNSLAEHATVTGISRIVGEYALGMFHKFMETHDATIELEAPPVVNDSGLVRIARESAAALGLTVKPEAAKFRDETAWAGPISLPWADPSLYPPGAERILHFFTSGGNDAGALHGTFHPDEQSVERQVSILYEIVKRI
ncbi:MAG: M20/M25/M40 family metallo-hydrolase [Nanoarchaeota archaeon]|nr:M20/M25/M40 family metallo-hydrolase [Nanoarchaeota archaeon]